MTLSKRPTPYLIPEYSLTGDLIAYLMCGLQYRYHNKGSLPPSKPVQLWFGEFIHGVMEESYLLWRDNNLRQFPWPWDTQIRNIELQIDRRLRSKGLFAPPNLFCRYDATETSSKSCINANHPHKLLASKRAEASINTWGPHLFPLVSEAEVKLKSIRHMPNYNINTSRSNYYGITGRVDVISSVNIFNSPPGNLILNYLNNDNVLQNAINNLNADEFEIIIDYKGMRRPPANEPTDRSWEHHEWQVLTYAWLRAQQRNTKPVLAGILFYLNELEPSKDDIKSLQEEIQENTTDLIPNGNDLTNITNWATNQNIPPITRNFKEKRSIRIINVDNTYIQSSLNNFDGVVNDIEISVLNEINGMTILNSWENRPERRTCTACDFKTFCPQTVYPQFKKPTVP